MKREKTKNMNHNIGKEIEQCLKVMEFLEESTDDYLFLYDFKTGKIHFTGKIHEKYNLSRKKEIYQIEEVEQIVYARDLPAVRRQFKRVEEGKTDSCNIECRLIDRNGDKIWISCRGKSRINEQGVSEILFGRISDTVMRQKVDPLTGLLNISCFLQDLENCIKKGKKGYLMVLGIDDLKSINIKQGRGYGNYILKMVAEIMEEVVDMSSSIYRLDGDRYAVNLEDMTKAVVQTTYLMFQEKLAPYCTMSAGVAAYGEEVGEGGSVLYQYAENALDRAKKQGGNHMVFFSAEDYEKRLSAIELQEELKYSIKHGFSGFYLCYQPQISCTDYGIFGAEALLRYDSPKRGRISPEEFIPILEQSDMIIPVGEWVLETALRQCKYWTKWIPEFHISVNVSYVQLRHEGITEKVLSLLKKMKLPGESLTLEVTESMQMQDYEYFNRIFYMWRKCGIHIAIDDFGTGYSSLGYLKSMEINEIKIDRYFVSRIQHSAYNYRLISNIIELAHSAQLRVCCEGVEEEEELLVLKDMEPDTLQGYLFAKPYEADEFEKRYIKKESPLYHERETKREYFCRLYGDYSKPGIQEKNGKEDLGVIAENLDEVVYISDMDSYELYYLNPAGRILTGIHDYKGRKCYKVLQGRNDPCEFCTNHKLSTEYFYVWERENTFLERYFLLKDKLIQWKGKKARLEVAVDVTEKEVVSQRIQEKLDFERNISACTRVLFEEPNIDKAVMEVLQMIGEFYQADRSYIFESEADGMLWNNTYEWCEKGVLPQRDELQKVPLSVVQSWADAFDRGESIVILNLEHLQESEPEMYEVLRMQGVYRLLVTAIKKGQYNIGFIGVDNPRSHHEDVRQLHTISCFLADRLYQSGREEGWGEAQLDFIRRDVGQKYIWRSAFYEAMLSETVAFAEVDVESGELKASGGLWKFYMEECRKKKEQFHFLLSEHAAEQVHPEDVEQFRHFVKKELYNDGRASGIQTKKLCFRRHVNGAYSWMKLVVHVFRDQYTNNVYELLYLENIDLEKRKEKILEKAANLDPLTGVYNRTVFEREVGKYMSQKGSRGALVILDLDDFKEINDLYGHVRGDEALKTLTKVLRMTFRHGDLIGRFGGDEFMVFIKGIEEKAVLDRRMDELFSALCCLTDLPLRCSAGITFVSRKGFSYKRSLEQADQALYESKKRGKDRYCYYDMIS